MDVLARVDWALVVQHVMLALMVVAVAAVRSPKEP
jgi:hypothetical protein